MFDQPSSRGPTVPGAVGRPDESRRFVARLKRRILAATVVAAAALWALAATHVVGVTAARAPAPTTAPARVDGAPSAPSNDFFGGPTVRSGPGLSLDGGTPFLSSGGS